MSRTPFLWGEEQVLRSRAKSQWIAVWWLLYHLQHPGRYLSRLQTDWLTHDIASVGKVRQMDPCPDDSWSEQWKGQLSEAKATAGSDWGHSWRADFPVEKHANARRGSIVRSPCLAEILP